MTSEPTPEPTSEPSADPQPVEPASLTQQEAEERAALIAVERYDIEVDLRGLLEGELWQATSTIGFACAGDGSSFVDCVGEVSRVVLDGEELDLGPMASDLARGRIPLDDLGRGEHQLVVASSQTDTASGTAIKRTVDAADGLVYLWTSFEPDGARRAWACFDQPDLKAPHGFTVDAPAAWTVTSNSAPEQVTDGESEDRRWEFADTPPLSTYVVVVNAGPFHEVREQRGDHSLGLFCRQSLRPFLERDTEELLRVVEQGLAFFGERFAMPFPQERYDHVFVPDLGGAMENWGCVTTTDALLFRSAPTYAQRQSAASLVLHEMAHMWFGDLVTMRWWDDLWLNEAFASFAASWASTRATEYVDAWAAFAVGREVAAYGTDRSPATHPIRSQVPDVAHAFASFDDITYAKGEAVLRQLMELVGEDQFVDGLRAYFAEHAWGNTRLADLIGAVSTASGRDLDAWSAAWLDRQGTDTLSLIGTSLVATSPDDQPTRPHRVRIGSYRRSAGADNEQGDAGAGSTGLAHVGTLDIEVGGSATRLADLPDADLHLVNDGDLTFASVRTDERSLQTMLASASLLPDAISRAVAVTTAWDMLNRGELSSGETLDCVLGVLATESSAGIVEALFGFAVDTAETWTPTQMIARRLARVAEVAATRSREPDVRRAALNALAASAATPEQLELLAEASVDNVDLAWRTLTRRAALGEDWAGLEPEVAALRERDPDPESGVSAWSVQAARPDDEAKAEAWQHFFVERAVPAGVPRGRLARAFWRPQQHDLLVPWAHRYLDELPGLARGGLLSTLGLSRAMAPTTCDQAWLDRATSMAGDDQLSPVIRNQLLGSVDQLTRVLAARD